MQNAFHSFLCIPAYLLLMIGFHILSIKLGKMSEYDDYEDESYIDGLLTDGRIDVDASEMFGDEVIGYSLY